MRHLREGAGHSQEGFASVVGVHRTTMGRIERGDFNVTLGTLERIAKALKIPVSGLIAEAEGDIKVGNGENPTKS